MVTWPPSPTVEDEHSSLAKEHPLSPVLTETKSADDHCVPSRGSINQFPIIVTSDSEDASQTKSPPSNSDTRGKSPKEANVSVSRTDDYGLPTPPSSDTEDRGRSRVNDLRASRSEAQQSSRSKSCDATLDTNPTKTRPSIPRIHTANAEDFQRFKSDICKDRSFMSAKLETAAIAGVQYLSADCATSSPVSMHSPAFQVEPSSRRHERDSSTESVRRPKKVTRFSDVLQGPGPSYGTPRGSSVPPSRLSEVRQCQSDEKQKQDTENPRTGRKTERRLPGYGSQDVPQEPCRSASRPSSSTPTTRQPQQLPITSTNDCARDAYRRESVEQLTPVPLMQKFAEKLRSNDTASQSTTQNKSTIVSGDNTKRTYYVKDEHYSITPPSVTTPKHMEDYFSQAFERNSQKRSRHSPRVSIDGSAYLSPPASPPHTPRGERSSKTYVDSPCASPRRMSRQSRLPSWDENQYIELKAARSLLSQATTAATIAAKISPPSSRNSTTTIDTISSGPPRNPIPKSRSRPVSPIRESRSESARRRYPSLPPSNRSSMQDNKPADDLHAKQPAPPARAITWTSHDIQYLAPKQPANSLHVKSGLPSPLPSPLHTAVPIFAAQTGLEFRGIDAKRPFVLPRCPRSRPLPGLLDWTKIKGIHGVRICPTCANAISETRYRKFLERSVNDQDDQEITCAMSRSWMRIAFMQSLNRNEPDLKFVEDVTSLTNRHRPCAGPDKDLRRWFRVRDPTHNALIPNFFVCSTCVRAVDKVFPDIPDQFQRDERESERTCNLHTGSRDFLILVEQLDALAKASRDQRPSRLGSMNCFVNHVHHIAQRPVCARERFITNGTWHFMDDLPEFTVCEACFDEIVVPMGDKPLARLIPRVPRQVPRIPLPGSASPTTRSSSQAVSCQLYSDKMRRYFADAADGLITYDKFKTKAKERFTTQWQLNQTSKRYQEDQKAIEFLKTEVDRKLKTWLMME